VSPLILTFLTFGTVVAAIGGVYSIAMDVYLRDRSRVGQRVDEEFRRQQKERVKQSLLFRDAKKLNATPANEMTELTFRQRVEVMINQSALEITFETLVTLAVVLALGLGAAVGLFRNSIIVAIISFVIGGGLPFYYVQRKRKARLAKLLEQLPDAFDLMGRVIRAGQTTAQAMLAVADEFSQPIAGEFSYCYEQQNLGLSPEYSLRDLARRTGLLEIKIFVTALLVQQQTGGNMAELLDKLSTMIRQRAKLRGQIKTLTAEGRFQAIILVALPIMLFCIMFFINRDYAGELLDHPSLITTTVGFEVLGGLWIRKIVNFDF